MRTGTVAAVDLGASSGRVMTVRVGPGTLDLTEAHRFANRPVRVRGTLHWDVLDLYRGVLDGLRAAGRAAGRLDGVGVDGWAVDVGLLDDDGALLGNPVHYRDPSHRAGVDAVHAVVDPEELYAVNGLQHLPFNTVFQLAARQGGAAPGRRAADAARARPAGVLADRRGRGGGHQRLHHRPARRADPPVVHRPGGAARAGPGAARAAGGAR